MSLSEMIIRIHSIASDSFGDLEADEIITSLLVLVINDLKDSSKLSPKNLEEAFAEKIKLFEASPDDYDFDHLRLSLVKAN